MPPAEGAFDRGYRCWGLAHAAVLIALVVSAELSPVRPYAFAMLAVWSAVAMVALFSLSRRTHPDGQGSRIANMLTTVRTVSAVFLFFGMAAGSVVAEIADMVRGPAGWWLVVALLLIETTDFFDGKVARREKAGRFGAIWDMENDALFALALSMINRHGYSVGFYVLLIGLMRYFYVLLWRHENRSTGAPRIQFWYSKTTAAVLVTTMIVVLAPIVGPGFRAVSLFVVLVMQIISFGWDLLLQCRSRSHSSVSKHARFSE